jgi:hypothetical protein
MERSDYWEECVQVAAEECGATLTHEQIEYIAQAAQSCHENYGMAFYSPPAGDRISAIERECRAKVKNAQDEADRIRSDFVANVCMRRRCDPSDVILEGGGHVTIRQ